MCKCSTSGDFVRDIATELLRSSGRDDVKLTVELEAVYVPAQQASPIALMLNELITNALKHAFPTGRARDACRSKWEARPTG